MTQQVRDDGRWLSVWAALLLSACGGGGSSDQAGINGSGLTPGGTDNPAVASGPVTAFGSVFVNGVEFSTTAASISVDGVLADQSALRIGQIVEVQGTINSVSGRGTATTVTYANDLRGPVTGSVDTVAGTFVVMGRTVLVNGQTVFDGGVIDLADLATKPAGAVVEISGFTDSRGWLQATRVELQSGTPPANSHELAGVVSSWDASARTFTVEGTPVSAMTALVNGTLANGQCVRVKGNFSAGQFTAIDVQVRSRCGVTATSGRGEVEGAVTAVQSATRFSIGALTIDASAVSASVVGLSVDTQVEVEGSFDSSGVLVASKIEVKQGTDTRIIGTVDSGSINSSAKTFKMFGMVVTVTAKTQWVDQSSQRLATFGLADLQVGDYLEVRGAENATHTGLTAVTVERRAPDTKLEVRGIALPVNATDAVLTPPSFKLMGTTVQTQSSDFTGNAEATFYSSGIRDLVRIRAASISAAWNGTQLNPDRVEIEQANP